MSKRYVKRVSEIQAIQYNGNNAIEVVEFVGDELVLIGMKKHH